MAQSKAQVTTELILRILPLAIEAFGAISKEVIELRAAAGLSDDELLDHASATDEATLAAIQKHLEELSASGVTIPAPATEPAAEEPPQLKSVLTPNGALIHGQTA